MKTQSGEDTLFVQELDRLSALNSRFFKEGVAAMLEAKHRHVEIDCSKVKFIDSEGLGALVSVHKLVGPRNGVVRLTRVQPMVRQFLELVNFQRILEIHD